MRAVAISIAVTLVAAGISGCGESHVGSVTAPSPLVTVGSGRFVTDSRPVRDFDAIRVAAGGRAIVTQSDVESLNITAEDRSELNLGSARVRVPSWPVRGRRRRGIRSTSRCVSSRVFLRGRVSTASQSEGGRGRGCRRADRYGEVIGTVEYAMPCGRPVPGYTHEPTRWPFRASRATTPPVPDTPASNVA